MIPDCYHHFRHLLIQKGSVSVPGVGTFFRSYQPATVIPEKEQVLPPGEIIRFKDDVQLSVLFSGRLTEFLFLHPETAQQYEAELGGFMRQSLDSKGELVLPALGKLQRSEGENLLFSPERTEVLMATDKYYGLQPVSVTTKPKPSDLPDKTPAPMKNGPLTHESLNGKSSINWQPYLLVGLLVVIGVLIIYNGPFMNQHAHLAQGVEVNVEQSTPFNQAYVGNESTEPIASAEQGLPQPKSDLPATNREMVTVGNTSVSAPGSSPTGTDPNARLGRTRGMEENNLEETAAIGEVSGNLSDLVVVVDDQTQTMRSSRPVSKELPVYHLISASFTRMETAQSYLQEISSEGYQTEILVPKDGPSTILRVSIFQSNDLSEVKAFQKHLQLAGKELLWIFEE
jgi:hypothetical protein